MKKQFNHAWVAIAFMFTLLLFSPIIIVWGLGYMAHIGVRKIVRPVIDKIMSYYEY